MLCTVRILRKDIVKVISNYSVLFRLLVIKLIHNLSIFICNQRLLNNTLIYNNSTVFVIIVIRFYRKKQCLSFLFSYSRVVYLRLVINIIFILLLP